MGSPKKCERKGVARHTDDGRFQIKKVGEKRGEGASYNSKNSPLALYRRKWWRFRIAGRPRGIRAQNPQQPSPAPTLFMAPARTALSMGWRSGGLLGSSIGAKSHPCFLPMAMSGREPPGTLPPEPIHLRRATEQGLTCCTLRSPYAPEHFQLRPALSCRGRGLPLQLPAPPPLPRAPDRVQAHTRRFCAGAPRTPSGRRPSDGAMRRCIFVRNALPLPETRRFAADYSVAPLRHRIPPATSCGFSRSLRRFVFGRLQVRRAVLVLMVSRHRKIGRRLCTESFVHPGKLYAPVR